MCSRTYKAAACSQGTVRSYFQRGGTCHLCMSLLTNNKVSEQGPRSLLCSSFPLHTDHLRFGETLAAQGPVLWLAQPLKTNDYRNSLYQTYKIFSA